VTTGAAMMALSGAGAAERLSHTCTPI
jgi:hypothetical protein